MRQVIQTNPVEKIVNTLTEMEERLFLLEERRDYEIAKYGKCKDLLNYYITLYEQKIDNLYKEYRIEDYKTQYFHLDNKEEIINNFNATEHTSGLILIQGGKAQ